MYASDYNAEVHMQSEDRHSVDAFTSPSTLSNVNTMLTAVDVSPMTSNGLSKRQKISTAKSKMIKVMRKLETVFTDNGILYNLDDNSMEFSSSSAKKKKMQ